MSRASDPDDLVLHGPRVLGFASAASIASRYDLPVDLTEERLSDYEAYGWVRHSSFADSSGWSLTDRGREEDERRMGLELDRAGLRAAVTAAHDSFLPLNRRFLRACTRWQLRPAPSDRLAVNDHSDWGWDDDVLRTLTSLGAALRRVCDPLAAELRRFDGYADRYAAALGRVDAGHRAWVDSVEVDSCHTVWIQLHEDLVATLGVPRVLAG